MNIFKTNIKKIKKTMLREKEKTLLRYKITEEYLVERISQGELEKRDDLKTCREDIKELENLISFLKK